MMDPLAAQVLENHAQMQNRRRLEGRERQRYAQARSVRGSVGKHAKDTWNRIGPMRLYLCDSVREQLQKAIQAEADQAYKERYG